MAQLKVTQHYGTQLPFEDAHEAFMEEAKRHLGGKVGAVKEYRVTQFRENIREHSLTFEVDE